MKFFKAVLGVPTMYKCEFENGPAWFNEQKSYILSLSPTSHKKINAICPECGKERSVSFSNITNSKHSYCNGCSRRKKSEKELLGKRFGKLVVVGFAEPYIAPSDGKKTTVCICSCVCGEQVKVRGDSLKTGNTTSCGCAQREAVREIGRSNSGALNPMYNFDLTDEQRAEREDARRDIKYKVWAKAVKKRDGCCIRCGSKNKLEAHHIEGFSINKKRRYDVTNGITLCAACHDAYHNRFLGNAQIPAMAGSLNSFILNSTNEKMREAGRSVISILEDIFG